MVRDLLIRGMLAGFVAGLLAFGFAKIFGEPQVDRAIAFEEQMNQAKAQQSMAGMNMSTPEAAEPELISRGVQSTIGLFTGVVVYGAAVGGIFSLVFAFAYGRVGRFGPRATAALLAGAALVAVVIVPELKYPANSPSVGEPGTITYRSEMFFAMILASVAALWLAIVAGRRLVVRHGAWSGSLLAATRFVAIVAVVQLSLPAINEVPAGFPAAVLWGFRISSLGIQVIMWAALGLIFGALAERLLAVSQIRDRHYRLASSTIR